MDETFRIRVNTGIFFTERIFGWVSVQYHLCMIKGSRMFSFISKTVPVPVHQLIIVYRYSVLDLECI
jgi:hypothetical protein